MTVHEIRPLSPSLPRRFKWTRWTQRAIMFPAKNLDHFASFFLGSSIRRRTIMASASPKTMLDFLRPGKRLKVEAIPGDSIAKSSDPSGLSPEQKTRIEINKLLARSKRNLSICSERIKKNTGKSFLKTSELFFS